MLSLHLNEPGGHLANLPEAQTPEASKLVWIDLLNPTREEELEVEAHLGLDLPTREDMAEIEASSRLYVEDGAAYMTAVVTFFGGAEVLQSGPVTFVLSPGKLVTIRYIEPRSFDIFLDHCTRQPNLRATASMALVNLLDTLIDRSADLIEKNAEINDGLSRAIFRRRREESLEDVIIGLGRAQSDISKIRDSLVTFARLIAFSQSLDDAIVAPTPDLRSDFHDRLKTLAQDVASLSDHVTYVTGNITFLLDAALGLINTEQNNTFKLLSIVTVIFLPLTLMASIYGMNFAHIPFAQDPMGFWAMILVMALITVGLMIWFKRRKWL